MLVDTHAHLDEHAFEADLPEVLARAAAAGVTRIVTIGISAATSQAALSLARAHPHVSAVVGIQPNYVTQAGADDMDLICGFASDPHVVAIGETGLDKYWDFAPLDVQQEYFVKHLELARDVQKPFIIHCREAEAEVVQVLREFAAGGQLNGVMHSFAGDMATAQACLELGLHLSFSGMLTYKSNQALRDVARQTPRDKLLVETDSPYLSPVPLRGKRNEPANVVHTARCLAELQGITLEELAHQTSTNAAALFGWEEGRGRRV